MAHVETSGLRRLDRRAHICRFGRLRRRQAGLRRPDEDAVQSVLGRDGEGRRCGAKKAGVDVYLNAVESDQAAEPQLNACNTMLQKKPAAMITAAINSTILLPCLKQAN